NRDRVVVDNAGAGAGALDLCVDPLADVRIRTAPVARELVEDRPQLADPLGALLADEAALDHLHLGPVGHWHRATQGARRRASPSRRGCAWRAPAGSRAGRGRRPCAGPPGTAGR